MTLLYALISVLFFITCIGIGSFRAIRYIQQSPNAASQPSTTSSMSCLINADNAFTPEFAYAQPHPALPNHYAATEQPHPPKTETPPTQAEKTTAQPVAPQSTHNGITKKASTTDSHIKVSHKPLKPTKATKPAQKPQRQTPALRVVKNTRKLEAADITEDNVVSIHANHPQSLPHRIQQLTKREYFYRTFVQDYLNANTRADDGLESFVNTHTNLRIMAKKLLALRANDQKTEPHNQD